ncbi:MAG: ATP-grasp domain-containing protein [Pontiellaceae bacterium]|nr:ATP-grasp domain-containing protein [Pontiellaceae bacterium]MBN2783851.1 ATP-grasp domain-containing protein [Pontiellaceae bacterium]
MFFIDKPFVSDFLKSTLKEYQIPVVEMPQTAALQLFPGTLLISPEQAMARFQGSGEPVYMNSENAIGWLAQHDAFAALSARIELFKDKAAFRRLMQPVYPDFWFREVSLNELPSLDISEFLFPFIIKPSVGFFSLGVHYVATPEEWPETVSAIQKELKEAQGMYPPEVMNAETLILEECIEGEEYAVDAYFDADGNPVVLGILKHVFSSADDVSDRVYMTSGSVFEENLGPFTAFLQSVGKRSGVKAFPIHVELRKDAAGMIRPIEINPMRFGGWCTTADLTHHAFGINPYVCLAQQIKPDWPALLARQSDDLFALIVLDNSTGVAGAAIASFDYDALLSRFEKPLELRRTNVAAYQVFGFLMTQTRPDHAEELTAILHSDLTEFITVKP